MTINRLRAAAAKRVRERAESLAAREQRNATLSAHRTFESSWMNAYPRDVPYESEEFTLHATERLMRLGEDMQSRYWDFHLAGFRTRADIADRYDFASLILQFAALGETELVRTCVTEAAALMTDIISAHEEIFGFMTTRAMDGMPYTPPVTRRELFKLAGISEDTLNGQIKTKKKWTTLDPVAHQRLKRWRATDNAVQQKVLSACRLKKWRHLLDRKMSVIATGEST